MSVMDSVKKIGFRKVYEYLDKDPDANIPKLMDCRGWPQQLPLSAGGLPPGYPGPGQQLVPADPQHVD